MAGQIKINDLIYGSLILLCVVTLCDGIICFNCHSSSNSKCGDNFRIQTNDIDSRFDCPIGSCYKKRGKRSDGEVRRNEVRRGCTSYRDNGCYTVREDGIDQHTCICNSNFCNTSSVQYASTHFLLFCGFLIFFFGP